MAPKMPLFLCTALVLICLPPLVFILQGQSLQKDKQSIRQFSSLYDQYLPKCIVIGVRKAGTRALLQYLNLHPRVVIAKQELHFFDKDYEYSKGLEYYRTQMPYTYQHQITIEKTPTYFVKGYVPERIYYMNSSILLLLVVRDPVTRLISDYLELKDLYFKNNISVKIGPFESEVLDKARNVRTDYEAVKNSHYATYFRRWLEYFPRKQIHVVDGDKLIEDPFSEVYEVETFLGIEHEITRDKFYFDDAKGFFCMNKPGHQACLGDDKGRAHPTVNPEVLLKLRQFYRKENEMFFKLVNKTFNW